MRGLENDTQLKTQSATDSCQILLLAKNLQQVPIAPTKYLGRYYKPSLFN